MCNLTNFREIEAYPREGWTKDENHGEMLTEKERENGRKREREREREREGGQG